MKSNSYLKLTFISVILIMICLTTGNLVTLKGISHTTIMQQEALAYLQKVEQGYQLDKSAVTESLNKQLDTLQIYMIVTILLIVVMHLLKIIFIISLKQLYGIESLTNTLIIGAIFTLSPPSFIRATLILMIVVLQLTIGVHNNLEVES